MKKRTLTEEQLQARREYGKKYRQEHRAIENERQKRYRQNNSEKVKAQKKQYRKIAYERTLEKLGKSRKPHLSEEEKKARRLKKRERSRVYAHQRYVANFVSAEKICKYCGTPFMTQYKKSKTFCSEECKNKYALYAKKIAEKRRKGKITALDRLDNDITLPLLFKRDKGICKLCGGKCEWGDIETASGFAVVGKNYPSIDHITPISKGGLHTWDNVQLAHHFCNSKKSNH